MFFLPSFPQGYKLLMFRLKEYLKLFTTIAYLMELKKLLTQKRSLMQSKTNTRSTTSSQASRQLNQTSFYFTEGFKGIVVESRMVAHLATDPAGTSRPVVSQIKLRRFKEVANGLGVVVVRPVNTRHRWDETCLLDIIVIKSTDVVGMALPVQNINHSAFRSMFEKEKLSGNNFNEWFARLKLVLRVEKKMHVIEQPLPPAHEPVVELNVVDQWTALYDAHTEIACLMLGSMTP
ncbi:hypothetical protein Tco_1071915, partial [Tanacetum coccineum]